MKDFFKKGYWFIAGIIVFVLFSTIKSYRNSNLLKRDGVVVSGKVIEYRHVQNSAYTLVYSYEVKGESYEGKIACSYFECPNDNSGCLKVIFPVIYSKSKPEVSDINLYQYNKYKGINVYY